MSTSGFDSEGLCHLSGACLLAHRASVNVYFKFGISACLSLQRRVLAGKRAHRSICQCLIQVWNLSMPNSSGKSSCRKKEPLSMSTSHLIQNISVTCGEFPGWQLEPLPMSISSLNQTNVCHLRGVFFFFETKYRSMSDSSLNQNLFWPQSLCVTWGKFTCIDYLLMSECLTQGLSLKFLELGKTYAQKVSALAREGTLSWG